MSLRQKAEKVPLLHLPGDFGALSRTEFTLATEHGMFRMTIGGYSGLSATERRNVTIRLADGTHVTSFDYVRKYLKGGGMRVSLVGLRGYPSFDSEAECVNAMTQHFIAQCQQERAA